MNIKNILKESLTYLAKLSSNTIFDENIFIPDLYPNKILMEDSNLDKLNNLEIENRLNLFTQLYVINNKTTNYQKTIEFLTNYNYLFSHEKRVLSFDLNSKTIPISNNSMDIRYIGSKDDIEKWLTITNQNSLFNLDFNTIFNLSKFDCIEPILIYKNKKPILSSLFYIYEESLNIHFIKSLDNLRNKELKIFLIKEAYAFAKREKLKNIILLSNEKNLEFFKSIGFEEQSNIMIFIKTIK